MTLAEIIVKNMSSGVSTHTGGLEKGNDHVDPMQVAKEAFTIAKSVSPIPNDPKPLQVNPHFKDSDKLSGRDSGTKRVDTDPRVGATLAPRVSLKHSG